MLHSSADRFGVDSPTAGTNCFAHEFSQVGVHVRLPATAQPKLAVNIPGDIYEQEADRVSDSVMRSPERHPHGTGPNDGTHRSYQAKQPNQEDDYLQATQVGSSGSGQTLAPPIVHEVLRSPGQQLDASTRAFFEPRFGYDFSEVRVHTDPKASESARSINALAYTVGQSIVIGTRQFAPHTFEGRHLLAHELTHVMQQRSQPRLIQRELYYAGGYKQRSYASNKDELVAAQSKHWFPATPDMAATAANSGTGSAVSTFSDLLTSIASKTPGSITKRNLIGHSSRTSFSLGGKITVSNVLFDDKATINAESLKDQAARIKGVRDRFAPGATIVLYGCDAGAGLPLLDAISMAFGTCVEGFRDEIWWCIELGKKGEMQRGRVWTINRNDPVPREEHPQECKDFEADITTLAPSQRSCAGVSPGATKP